MPRQNHQQWAGLSLGYQLLKVGSAPMLFACPCQYLLRKSQSRRDPYVPCNLPWRRLFPDCISLVFRIFRTCSLSNGDRYMYSKVYEENSKRGDKRNCPNCQIGTLGKGRANNFSRRGIIGSWIDGGFLDRRSINVSHFHQYHGEN